MACSVLIPVLFARFPISNVSSFFPPLSVIDKFDYVFAENGTVQYKNGQLVSKQVRPPPFATVALLPCAPWGAAPPIPRQVGSLFSPVATSSRCAL